jgi:hypothetical protein
VTHEKSETIIVPRQSGERPLMIQEERRGKGESEPKKREDAVSK